MPRHGCVSVCVCVEGESITVREANGPEANFKAAFTVSVSGDFFSTVISYN